MASSINPNNIDTAYPVAGQDNDSQGFRDNFTNIKTNFEYAETEIDDLQAKGIFKSALTGTTLDNDMSGAVIKNTKTQGYRATRVALGAISGSAAIDYSGGNWYSVTTDGSITLAFSNIPSAGNQAYITVVITVANVAHTVTLPSAVGNGASAKSVVGIQGLVENVSGDVITFAETGTYEFQFHTDNGGDDIFLSELTRPRNRFVNPIQLAGQESVLDGGVASLLKTATYVTTDATGGGATDDITLAAGVEGQVKVIALYTDGGDNLEVTVTNAGWKASGTGTITFTEIGQTATCMYINDKWFVIGMGPGDSDTFPTLN